MFPAMDESCLIKTHHAIAVHLGLIGLEVGNITQLWTRRYKEKSAGSGSRKICLAWLKKKKYTILCEEILFVPVPFFLPWMWLYVDIMLGAMVLLTYIHKATVWEQEKFSQVGKSGNTEPRSLVILRKPVCITPRTTNHCKDDGEQLSVFII